MVFSNNIDIDLYKDFQGQFDEPINIFWMITSINLGKVTK